MKKNMFKTGRHQLDHTMDYRDGVYQPEDFHDDAFQIIDTSSTRHKEGKVKKEDRVSEGHKGSPKAGLAETHKAEARPESCSPDEKAEEFNRQARQGAGRKGSPKGGK